MQGLGSVRNIMKQHAPSVRASCRTLHAGYAWLGREGAVVITKQGFGLPPCNNCCAVHALQGLDEVVIASIMRPVLSALQHLHAANCIHRDVKVSLLHAHACWGSRTGHVC